VLTRRRKQGWFVNVTVVRTNERASIMKELGTLRFLLFLGALGWFGFAWDAYMTLSVYGSVLAVCAGLSFVCLARESSADKSLAWLFGWNDEDGELLLRCTAYASIFVGPAAKHLALWIYPELFVGAKVYVVVLVASIVVGIVVPLFFVADYAKVPPNHNS
jgi:hypothetical protein